MKRKASFADRSQTPTKLTKQTTNVKLDEKLTSFKNKKLTSLKYGGSVEPMRSSSFRERKAPLWLSSYVTNTSQEKEVKQAAAAEKPKLKIPRFPTLVPPSKRGKVEKKEDIKTDSTPSLLRKKSTVKLQTPSPPIHSSKSKKPPLIPTPSLSRKPTKIISLSGNSSPEPDAKSKPNLNGVKKSSASSKDLSSSLMKRHKLKVTKKSSSCSRKELSSLSKASSKPGRKLSTSSHSMSLKKIKEDTIPDSRVVELCDDPLNASTLPLSEEEKDDGTDNASNCSDVTPPIKDDSESKFKPLGSKKPSSKFISSPSLYSNAHSKAIDQTIILPEQGRPSMLEIVICISTSGALREYLQALQENIREIIWRLQSLVPNLRIGVMAHTQGGIHDDPSRKAFSGGDHNYNRAGGHSGTKWLDLGATMSQICAFVDSLESEPTVYPDYVQDNLEMALWKLQRCMSWSSCSYRSVIMIGRGRPNRMTFYHQKEHWRGWIRSALELPLSVDIPVIDWELEAKLLAEMGIHVFTIQAVAPDKAASKEKDEGTCFFQRVAEITQSQHIRIIDASKLQEIIIGICCACHGSDLLLDHRDTVRDENDGVLPTQLTEVFVGLQLHSKSNSLMSLPSMLRNLDITSMRQRLNGYESRTNKPMETNSALDNCMDYDSLRIGDSMEQEPFREEEMMETKISRAKTIRKIKTVRASNKNKVVESKVSSDKKMNGFDQKGNTRRQQGRLTKPYDIGKRQSDVKGKSTKGLVERFIKKLDTNAKKIVRKADKFEKAVNGRSTPNKVLGDTVNGRPLGKRQIKLSPKLKENLLSVKNGGVSKVKNRKTPVFTELKKKAVKNVLSMEVKKRGRPPAGNNKTNQTKALVSPGGKRKSSIELVGKREKRNAAIVKKKEKLKKLSPLKRSNSNGKSFVDSKKQKTDRNMRQKSVKK